MTQLTFPYGIAPKTNTHLLQSAANEPAIALLQTWLARPLGAGVAPGFVLTGPAGSGKSHLLRIEAARRQPTMNISFFTQGQLPNIGEAENHSGADNFIFIDDAHLCGGEALLRFYHQAQNRPVRYVLAGLSPLGEWAQDGNNEPLVDLVTRLRALPNANLPAPDETLLAMVFHDQLALRQVCISQRTADEAARSLRRSLHCAVDFAAVMDAEALEQKRAIDQKFIRETLEKFPQFTVYG